MELLNVHITSQPFDSAGKQQQSSTFGAIVSLWTLKLNIAKYRIRTNTGIKYCRKHVARLLELRVLSQCY